MSDSITQAELEGMFGAEGIPVWAVVILSTSPTPDEARRRLKEKLERGVTYTHRVSLGVEVAHSSTEDGADITGAQIRQALLSKLSKLDDGALHDEARITGTSLEFDHEEPSEPAGAEYEGA